MKKLYPLLTLFFGFNVMSAQVVNIPDDFFKFKLLQASTTNFVAKNAGNAWIKIDANSNGEIETTEAQEVTELYVNDSEIFDLTGINSFSNLKSLWCFQNYLSELDVTNLSHLEGILCSGNNLTTLDLSGLENLRLIHCFANQLTAIYLDGCTNLQNLTCHNNQLSSLDLTGLSQLTKLVCSTNQLTSLIVQSNENLLELECSFNQLTELILPQAPQLNQLYCSYNQFTSLDVSGLTALTHLGAVSNHLATLDCSNLSQLSVLYCRNNELTNLNIKNGAIETEVIFHGNPNLTLICADTAQLPAITSAALQNGNTSCVINDSCLLSTANFDDADTVTIYPNPVKDWLNIESGRVIDAVAIYNLLGQLVLAVPNASHMTSIDVSKLGKGHYFISLDFGSGSSNIRFIKI